MSQEKEIIKAHEHFKQICHEQGGKEILIDFKKKKISGNVTIVLIRNMQNTEKRQLGPKVYRRINIPRTGLPTALRYNKSTEKKKMAQVEAQAIPRPSLHEHWHWFQDFRELSFSLGTHS